MRSCSEFIALLSGRHLSGPAFALALVSVFAIQPASAQTFTVLHEFTDGADGAGPLTGLTIDPGGHLFGTTTAGGTGNGTVFEMKRAGNGWTFATLYTFLGDNGNDGATPEARVGFGPNGTLYGTTAHGGGGKRCGGGCGTVFNLRPPATICNRSSCPWTETILYRFLGNRVNDGFGPLGDLVFDQARRYLRCHRRRRRAIRRHSVQTNFGGWELDGICVV